MKGIKGDMDEDMLQAWSNWHTLTTISPERQLKLFVKIEHKFPLLCHCDDHYKAESIAFFDYSHWYNKWFPADDNKLESPT